MPTKITLETLPEHAQTHDKSNSWWIYDAQNIPLCRVCDACETVSLSRYRPEILRGYDQNDVDEPIELEQHHCDTDEGYIDY